MPRTSPAKLWLLELERERHDTSWRNPAPRHAPQLTPPQEKQRLKREVRKELEQELAIDQRKRDNIMFHAGRHFAGARDPKAVHASKQVHKLINERKR